MKFPFFSKKTKSPASEPQTPATILIPKRFIRNPETNNLEICLEDISLLWRASEDFSEISGTPEKKS
jgi:hypothetical protein